jgi:hypothetical protein
MHQFSNNFHIYSRHRGLLDNPQVLSDYYHEGVPVIPLIGPDEECVDFVDDCRWLVDGNSDGYATRFFNTVAKPALWAWKSKSLKDVELMEDCDWKVAMTEYLQRRLK